MSQYVVIKGVTKISVGGGILFLLERGLQIKLKKLGKNLFKYILTHFSILPEFWGWGRVQTLYPPWMWLWLSAHKLKMFNLEEAAGRITISHPLIIPNCLLNILNRLRFYNPVSYFQLGL